MKPLRPAPLFSIALAFGTGSVLGLVFSFSAWVWLVFFILSYFFWRKRLLKKDPPSSVGKSFVLLIPIIIFAAAFHTAVFLQVPSPLDLTQLPEWKFQQEIVWHGKIDSFPVFRSAARRGSLGSVVFLFRVIDYQKKGEQRKSAIGVVQVHLQNISASPYGYGDELLISSGLQLPPSPRNPGQFDEKSWLKEKGVDYEIVAEGKQVQQIESSGKNLNTFAQAIKLRILSTLRVGLENDPQVLSVLNGIVLGDAGQLPDDLLAAFRNTNTYHIFAVSGQDIAVVLAIGIGFFQIVGWLRWRWAWVLTPVLLFYCVLTGAHPSAIRAVMMAFCVLLAWRLDRPVSTLNLWACAVIFILVLNPLMISNLSFQLSFGVVLGLILLARPIFQWFYSFVAIDPLLLPSLVTKSQRRKDHIWRTILTLFASSIAAWIGSFPFLLYYFHQISLIGLFSNLLVVPLSALILIIGVISVASSIFGPGFVLLFNNANWLFIKILIWIVLSLNQIPYGNFFVPDFYLKWRPDHPEFICAQTGATSSLLIRYRNQAWLVNPGDNYHFQTVIDPLRKFYGINRFSEVFVTELSAATAGGSPALVKMNLCKNWVIPPIPDRETLWFDSFFTTTQQKRVNLNSWKEGEKKSLAPNFSVEVIAPNPSKVTQRSQDSGFLLLFHFHDQSLLWAGRIGFGTEMNLQKIDPNLHANILIEDYNQAEPNLTPEWIQQLAPSDVVVSAPVETEVRTENNPDSFFARKGEYRLWDQNKTGCVFIEMKSDKVEIKPFLLSPDLPPPLF